MAGDVVMRQGDMGNEMYFIGEGSVEVGGWVTLHIAIQAGFCSAMVESHMCQLASHFSPTVNLT
jgi:hypothetical protein